MINKGVIKKGVTGDNQAFVNPDKKMKFLLRKCGLFRPHFKILPIFVLVSGFKHSDLWLRIR